MERKVLSLLLVLMLSAFVSRAQSGGYVLIFGGDFKEQNVAIECLPLNFSEEIIVSTDESTSISKDFLFFDSSFFNRKIQIAFKGQKKRTVLTLRKTTSLRYIYVWYIRKKISYEILNNRLALH